MEIKVTKKDDKSFEGQLIQEKTLVGTINVGQISTTNNDYDELFNKPSINSITLQGNKELDELGIQEEMIPLSNSDLEELMNL